MEWSRHFKSPVACTAPRCWNRPHVSLSAFDLWADVSEGGDGPLCGGEAWGAGAPRKGRVALPAFDVLFRRSSVLCVCRGPARFFATRLKESCFYVRVRGGLNGGVCVTGVAGAAHAHICPCVCRVDRGESAQLCPAILSCRRRGSQPPADVAAVWPGIHPGNVQAQSRRAVPAARAPSAASPAGGADPAPVPRRVRAQRPERMSLLPR